MRIGVLAYEGCLAAEIFVFTDLLRIANRVARETGAATEDPFRVSVIAASAEPVAAAGGFPVGAKRWHHRFDRLIVPGFELVPSEDVAARLGSLQRETTFLRAAAERGTRIASVCVGAFLLGEADLLAGRRATTSWLFASRLARRYPRTTVCPEALIVTDGTITTTAAFSAALDLATALVREHLGDDVAGAFHVSTRTLLRRFRAETGESPLDFLRRARVRAARNLLETTDLPLARLIERVGYRDAGTFRRLFVEQVGMNPADYRRKLHGDASPVAM
ncbi:AraC family transcriptional regulator [Prescottella equi]|uniref:GlxA family transcriptional regulator n=1 Tax=Rhodococcus hoagii TaxID=43767 RepID=UPI0009BF3C4B|nr:helix-turn-helix domain-containing protein [Prescottella equi]OQQ33654.1 AraC family transcriptional regulator [Prescottella equi]